MALKTANDLNEPGRVRTQADIHLDFSLVRPGIEKLAEPSHPTSEIINVCLLF